jgi:MFS family permease
LGEDEPVLSTPVRPTKVAESLWQRGFAWLWGGSSVSLLGSTVAATAQPLLALYLTDSPILAGWVALLGSVPGTLLQLPAGVLVDRVDRQRVMVVSQYIRLAAAVLLCAALVSNVLPIVALLVTALVNGVFGVLYVMAEAAVIPQLVPSGLLSPAMAKNEARNHVALLAGRPLGGLLYATGNALPVVFDAVSTGFSLITLHKVRIGRSRNQRQDTSEIRLLDDIKEGFAYVWRDSFLRMTLLVCTVTNFALQSVSLLLIVLAKSEGFSGRTVAFLLAGPGAGGVVGALIAPIVLRRLLGNNVWGLVGFCVTGWFFAVAAIALSGRFFVLFSAWAAVNFFGAHLNVALGAYQAERMPWQVLGRVESANRFIARGIFMPIGTLLGGYGIAWCGAEAIAIVITAIIGGIVIVFWAAFRVVRPGVVTRSPGVIEGRAAAWQRTSDVVAMADSPP